MIYATLSLTLDKKTARHHCEPRTITTWHGTISGLQNWNSGDNWSRIFYRLDTLPAAQPTVSSYWMGM